jgi:hypothetical protein
MRAVPAQFYWEERGNLSRFVELAAANNLFVNLRIGPYVCAEWAYGGIPEWLGFKARRHGGVCYTARHLTVALVLPCVSCRTACSSGAPTPCGSSTCRRGFRR